MADRNNLGAALELAERGFRVLPLHTVNGDRCDCGNPTCPSPAKHPRIRDWPKQATSDTAQVTTWWTTWPAANVGIATGAESGLVVIDVDNRNGGYEELVRLYTVHGNPPPGPVAYTGGGGYHLYFRHPGGTILSRAIAPGIDCKGDGGQVVVPPSYHRSGCQYEWCETDISLPLPTLPDWLLLLCKSDQEDGARFTETALAPTTVPTGERNNVLTSLGGSMRRRGFGQEAIFRALLAENAQRCDPPLAAEEVAQIAASVSRYAPQEGIVISTHAPEGVVQPGQRPRCEPRTYTLRELQGMQLPPMRWAVQDMIPVGLTLLCGRLKLGKSWLALGLGCAIAEGGIALGTVPVENGEVLMLSYEDSQRRLQGRAITLLGAENEWPERLQVAPTGCWPTRDEGGLSAVDAWLGSHPAARLVVIDTLQRFRGGSPVEGNSNAYAADYQVSAELQELAMKHGVAILVIHHYRKSLAENDWVDQISGTNGIAGAADTLLGFERRRNEDDAILRVTGRDIRDAEWAMRFDPAQYGWYISGTAEELQTRQEGQEFLEAIRDMGQDGPVHYKKVAEFLGRKHKSVARMAQRMTEKGLLHSLGNGVYAPSATALATPLYTNVAMSPPPPEGAISDSQSTDYLATQPMSPVSPPDAPGDMATHGDIGGDIRTAPDSVSENGTGDMATRKLKNADDLLARRGLARTPEEPCAGCGETNWLPRALGGFVCGTCAPWVTKAEQHGQPAG